MQEIVRDMTMGALSALAHHSIILPDKDRTELQRQIHEHVTRSVQIEAAVAMIVELENSPDAA